MIAVIKTAHLSYDPAKGSFKAWFLTKTRETVNNFANEDRSLNWRKRSVNDTGTDRFNE